MADVIGPGKAYAAAGGSLIGGAAAKIVVRIVNYKYPGFLDEDTSDAVAVLLTGLITTAAVYLTPHTLGASS